LVVVDRTVVISWDLGHLHLHTGVFPWSLLFHEPGSVFRAF
jgi:hypothetical protein